MGCLRKDFETVRRLIKAEGLEVLATTEALERGFVPVGEPILLCTDVSGVRGEKGHINIPKERIPPDAVTYVPGEFWDQGAGEFDDMTARYAHFTIQFYRLPRI